MKVNVLTVQKNQLSKIQRLWESLIPQIDYLNRWVVYDDCSTDGSAEWLKELSLTNNLVDFIPGDTNLKAYLVEKMNILFHHIPDDNPFMLVFGDTYLAPNALQNIINSYKPGILASAHRDNVDESGNVIAGEAYLEDEHGVKCLMQLENPYYAIAGNGLIATREIFDKVGYLDERYLGYGRDDYDFALRSMMNGYQLYRFHNVKIYHFDHPTKNSSPENIQLLENKLSGNGYDCEAQTITLDLHDFSVENNNLYYLDQLKKMLPKLKISMFYIPFDVTYFDRILDFQRKEGIAEIKKRSDWIELIPHGLTHKTMEMLSIKDDNYEVFFKGIEDGFKTYDLPMVKGFCAPQWAYSQSLVDYIDSIGWWMAVDRNQPDAPRTKRFYEYTHSIHEPFWFTNQKEIRLHGHISLPSPNNLPENLLNFFKINPNADFKFISEVI